MSESEALTALAAIRLPTKKKRNLRRKLTFSSVEDLLQQLDTISSQLQATDGLPECAWSFWDSEFEEWVLLDEDTPFEVLPTGRIRLQLEPEEDEDFDEATSSTSSSLRSSPSTSRHIEEEGEGENDCLSNSSLRSADSLDLEPPNRACEECRVRLTETYLRRVADSDSDSDADEGGEESDSELPLPYITTRAIDFVTNHHFGNYENACASLSFLSHVHVQTNGYFLEHSIEDLLLGALGRCGDRFGLCLSEAAPHEDLVMVPYFLVPESQGSKLQVSFDSRNPSRTMRCFSMVRFSGKILLSALDTQYGVSAYAIRPLRAAYYRQRLEWPTVRGVIMFWASVPDAKILDRAILSGRDGLYLGEQVLTIRAAGVSNDRDLRAVISNVKLSVRMNRGEYGEQLLLADGKEGVLLSAPAAEDVCGVCGQIGHVVARPPEGRSGVGLCRSCVLFLRTKDHRCTQCGCSVAKRFVASPPTSPHVTEGEQLCCHCFGENELRAVGSLDWQVQEFEEDSLSLVTTSDLNELAPDSFTCESRLEGCQGVSSPVMILLFNWTEKRNVRPVTMHCLNCGQKSLNEFLTVCICVKREAVHPSQMWPPGRYHFSPRSRNDRDHPKFLSGFFEDPDEVEEYFPSSGDVSQTGNPFYRLYFGVSGSVRNRFLDFPGGMANLGQCSQCSNPIEQTAFFSHYNETLVLCEICFALRDYFNIAPACDWSQVIGCTRESVATKWIWNPKTIQNAEAEVSDWLEPCSLFRQYFDSQSHLTSFLLRLKKDGLELLDVQQALRKFERERCFERLRESFVRLSAVGNLSALRSLLVHGYKHMAGSLPPSEMVFRVTDPDCEWWKAGHSPALVMDSGASVGVLQWLLKGNDVAIPPVSDDLQPRIQRFLRERRYSITRRGSTASGSASPTGVGPKSVLTRSSALAATSASRRQTTVCEQCGGSGSVACKWSVRETTRGGGGVPGVHDSECRNGMKWTHSFTYFRGKQEDLGWNRSGMCPKCTGSSQANCPNCGGSGFSFAK